MPRVVLSVISVSAALVSHAAFAADIPIINPSFEETSRTLAVGEQTNGVGGSGIQVATRFPFAGGAVSWADPVEVPGWRNFVLRSPSTAINRVGVLRPPQIGQVDFIQGLDGQHVLANQSSRCGQILDHLIQPNTRYRLDFLGGIGMFDSEIKYEPLTEQTFFILLSLQSEPKHGYAIAKDVQSLSNGRVSLSVSTLYTSLKRLLDGGWIILKDETSTGPGKPA